MPIDNPPHLLGCNTPLCAEDEALKISASGNAILTSKSAMDMVSVQRPDKVSACPRCQSLDTKFCYFNNYNMKQPRHFCRKCQRYWTAGGALRNVPVGAGRRKHKTLLNSTSPKLHPEENDFVLAHFGPMPGIASGMCYPSNKSVEFLPPSHMDGTRPHSFQCVAAMSINAHDHHSGLNACKGIREAMVNKPATESRFLHDAQSDIRQKEKALSSLRHHGPQKDIAHVQHRNETPSAEVLPGLYDENVEDQSSSPLPSHTSMDEKMEAESSASTCPVSDKKIAHPLIWLEQFAKANASVTSESIALQGAYGYGNASLAWSHPLMWPWLLPYASNNGPTCSKMDQAAVSAAWASAVTATAANILQNSHLWNPYGWGRDVNKSEGLSLLGKRERSSLHEQEPLCVPKTLKIGHPEEAMHSSILMTLGLSSLSTTSPASVAGFFNADFQPKADVLQRKPTVQLLQQQRSHVNPVAQARSLAFQESS